MGCWPLLREKMWRSRHCADSNRSGAEGDTTLDLTWLWGRVDRPRISIGLTLIARSMKPQAIPTKLPKKLKQIRLNAALSQTAIGKALDPHFPVHRNDISAFERATRQPSLNLLLAYARFADTCSCVLVDDDLSLDSESHVIAHSAVTREVLTQSKRIR